MERKRNLYMTAKYLFWQIFKGIDNTGCINVIKLTDNECNVIYDICKENGHEWLNEWKRAS